MQVSHLRRGVREGLLAPLLILETVQPNERLKKGAAGNPTALSLSRHGGTATGVVCRIFLMSARASECGRAGGRCRTGEYAYGLLQRCFPAIR
jgi:hypothetical protein